jgi:hypothetical protein
MSSAERYVADQSFDACVESFCQPRKDSSPNDTSWQKPRLLPAAKRFAAPNSAEIASGDFSLLKRLHQSGAAAKVSPSKVVHSMC